MKSESDQVWLPILRIRALHVTHIQSTHTANTHPQSSGQPFLLWHPGAVGVQCLAQGYLSRGIIVVESAAYTLPPPTIPDRPETQTHDLWVTSPTLYPLGHDCPYNSFGIFCSEAALSKWFHMSQKKKQSLSTTRH